jgi:uroporphyrinogen decarboxylase
MTERERVETLLRREKPDRVPIWPFAPHGFTAIYDNLTIKEAYTDPEAAYVSQKKASRNFGWVFCPTMIYASFGAWEFGGEVKMPSSEYDQAPTIIRHPVMSEEDVWTLKAPEGPTGFMKIAEEFARLASRERLDNEPFNASIGAGGSFTAAVNIAGSDRFLRWMIRKPEIAHHLLRLVTDWKLAGLQIAKNRDNDGVLPRGGEATASNQMISPRHCQEFVIPYFKEVQEKVLDIGFQTTWIHLCGDQNKNLPLWAEVPFGDPGIISIGHEVDLEKAGEVFSGHIIMGNLDPAIVQTGTPQEVYEAASEVVEKGKKIPGGYIFSLGCDVPPYADPENVMALTRAVNDHGWYNEKLGSDLHI